MYDSWLPFYWLNSFEHLNVKNFVFVHSFRRKFRALFDLVLEWKFYNIFYLRFFLFSFLQLKMLFWLSALDFLALTTIKYGQMSYKWSQHSNATFKFESHCKSNMNWAVWRRSNSSKMRRAQNRTMTMESISIQTK